MKDHRHTRRILNGFSLVELSIVLVILGLLVGGVLAGQSLIRAAEMRAVSSEYSRYVTAAQTFREKYFLPPGDLPNAIQFWGANPYDNGDGIGSDCRRESPDQRTCNGDGDGLIESSTTSATVTHENFLFWQHLANAGLIEGKYTGSSGTFSGNTICPTGPYVPGCTVPAGKISNSFWAVLDFGVQSANI